MRKAPRVTFEPKLTPEQLWEWANAGDAAHIGLSEEDKEPGVSASAVQSLDLLPTKAGGNAAATNHRPRRPRANEVASTPARRKCWRLCKPKLSGQRSAGVTMR